MLRRTLMLAAALRRKPHVVFITGDDEYRSEYSMPVLARILETHHKLKCSVCYARPTPQSNTNIEGLEALKDADLMVLFLRWRVLPEEQLKPILQHVAQGKPTAGFRTSTHSFNYPKDHPRQPENDGFPLRVFGAKWTRHHGHTSTTATSKAGSHPILNGVDPNMTLPSWLYTVNPLQGDITPLLTGRAINPERNRDESPQPVAWVKKPNTFFTTLGHPDDFKNESFRRLAVNGLLWALGRNIPRSGARVDFIGAYNPPPSGIPVKPRG